MLRSSFGTNRTKHPKSIRGILFECAYASRSDESFADMGCETISEVVAIWRDLGSRIVSCPLVYAGFVGLFLVTAIEAQQPKSSGAPSFEVVSIRPVPPNAPSLMRSQEFTAVLPGGQYIDSRTNLLFMISFAHNVKNPSKQLIGLPNWAKSQIFAVAAKPGQDFPELPPAQNNEQVRAMMRAMLADRFHLRLHTETRRERVLHLRVAKSGMRIPEVDAPTPPAKEGFVNAAMSDRSGRMIGNKATMRGMAVALTIFLKELVVDQTGLNGYYDFNVGWSEPEPSDGPSSGGLGSDGLGLLISNLQSQFGLELKKGTGQVEYWVIDHIEPPTTN